MLDHVSAIYILLSYEAKKQDRQKTLKRERTETFKKGL